MSGQHHHRGGSLKQSNKAHSGYKGHASKRSLKNKTRGRVLGGKSSGASALEHTRADRRNQSDQIRRRKRMQQLALKRAAKFGGPHVVAVVALAAGADLKGAIHSLAAQSKGGSKYVSSLGIQTETSVAGRPVTVDFPTYRKRVMFIEAARDLTAILDVAKVADTVLMVVPMNGPNGAEDCCDDLGIQTISVLLNQGIGNLVGVLQGLGQLEPKKKAEMKKYGQRLVHTEFGDKAKAIDADSPRMILRALAETPVSELGWRKLRTYFPAQKVTLQTPDALAGPPNATTDVAVEGYIQGTPLSANQLVHITGCGTFQVRVVKELPDPCPTEAQKRRQKQAKSGSGSGNSSSEPKAFVPTTTPDLAEIADADSALFAAEQTWPTADEIRGGGGGGFSSDEEDDEMSVDFDGQTSGGAAAAAAGGDRDDDDDDDDDDSDADSMDTRSHGPKMSVEEDAWGNEVEVAASERVVDMEQRRREEREDLEFPDEVDVPLDRPARDRFARYRGLESFRTTPWDPKESLPPEYARIFQFEDFRGMETKVRGYIKALRGRYQRELVQQFSGSSAPAKKKGSDSAGGGDGAAEDNELEAESISDSYAVPGRYVAVVLKDVPVGKIRKLRQERAVVVSSLLPHEQRLSVVHCRVKRHPSFTEPLKTKDLVQIHCGFRRRVACPLWSENNLRCDKHKMYRFFQSGDFGIVSVYFPITYAPCPVTVFKAEKVDPAIPPSQRPPLALTATGSVHCTDPDRIILKRITLTGYPMRVQGVKAVARMMFFNPEDIRWFMPVTLRTKYGLIGHIKEPMGVHGYMKCSFNKPIKNNDTICMSLYKRMFPKLVPKATRVMYGE